MKYEWANITKENVLTAINRFDESLERYPAAKTTFLMHNGKKYPAKHIRGMAYEVAYNKVIKKDEYSGGMETVRFFLNMGFNVQYHTDMLPENGGES